MKPLTVQAFRNLLEWPAPNLPIAVIDNATGVELPWREDGPILETLGGGAAPAYLAVHVLAAGMVPAIVTPAPKRATGNPYLRELYVDEKWQATGSETTVATWVESADGRRVCTMRPDPRDWSRAQLIAAAPELLGACRMALSCLAPDDNDATAQALRKAIAKAEGTR